MPSPLPDCYLVDGPTLRAMQAQLEDANPYQEDPNLPFDENKYDDWLPNEKDFLTFILSILGLQIITASTILKKNPTRRNIETTLNKIDLDIQRKLPSQFPETKKYMDSFYTVGKRKAWKDLEVTSLRLDATDNHALFFLRHHTFGQITALTDDMRENIRKVILEGVGQGRSMPQVAKTLREKVITEPLTVVNKRTGKVIRTISAKDRAIMIARTESMRAVNQGHLLTFQQYGIQEVNVNTAGDGHVCPTCSEDASNGPYVILSSDCPYLPEHPFCRCTYSMARESILNPGEPVYNLVTAYNNLVTNSEEKITADAWMGDLDSF